MKMQHRKSKPWVFEADEHQSETESGTGTGGRTGVPYWALHMNKGFDYLQEGIETAKQEPEVLSFNCLSFSDVPFCHSVRYACTTNC